MSNQLPNKLQQYEETPPPRVWSSIEHELDQQGNTSFVERLKMFEAQPPAHVWEKITETLSTTQPVKKVFTLNNYLARLSAAAAVLIIIALGIVNLSKDRKDNLRSEQTLRHSSGTQTATGKHGESQAGDQQEPITAKTGNESPGDISLPVDERDSENATKGIASFARRYMTVDMENGEKVRLSKKVLPVFKCADNATASISKRCKENIQNLQDKMASTLASPTTDFAGLVDMIKTLEENK